jgi:hypothetical protein
MNIASQMQLVRECRAKSTSVTRLPTFDKNGNVNWPFEMQYDAKAIEFFECGEALGPHEKNAIEPLDEKVKSDMMQPLGE